jgi:hypothetical protein
MCMKKAAQEGHLDGQKQNHGGNTVAVCPHITIQFSLPSPPVFNCSAAVVAHSAATIPPRRQVACQRKPNRRPNFNPHELARLRAGNAELVIFHDSKCAEIGENAACACGISALQLVTASQ